MQFRLRTLLIVLGLAPPALAFAWFAARIINSLPLWLSAPSWVLLLAPLWIPLLCWRRFFDYARSTSETSQQRSFPPAIRR